MICEVCQGNGYVSAPAMGSRVLGYEPCPECGGCGETHCCDGDSPSARDEVLEAVRPAPRVSEVVRADTAPEPPLEAALELGAIEDAVQRVGELNMPERIKHNDDGTLDEVVLHNCTAHLEQMSKGSWYLGLSRDGYGEIQVWLCREGKRVVAHIEVAREAD